MSYANLRIWPYWWGRVWRPQGQEAELQISPARNYGNYGDRNYGNYAGITGTRTYFPFCDELPQDAQLVPSQP